MNEWRLIDSAPKDGTYMLVAVPDKIREGFHVGEAYFDIDGNDWWWAGSSSDDYQCGPIRECNYHLPTHWMPMPEGPE